MVAVRSVREGDAPAMARIHRHSFAPAAMSVAMFAQFRMLWPYTVVAEHGGEVVGYCLVAEQGGVAWVPNIAVSEVVRGHGVGSVMLEKVIEDAREHSMSAVRLHVLTSNPAVRLYERLGFRQIDEVGPLLEDGHERIRMECRLKG